MCHIETMKILKSIVLNAYYKIMARTFTPLPVGSKEFETWADSIIALSGEYADRDSMRFAIASILIHADAKHGSLPKQYFVDRLRKSAANQIASQVFQEIKQKQAEESAKQKAEQPQDGK